MLMTPPPKRFRQGRPPFEYYTDWPLVEIFLLFVRTNETLLAEKQRFVSACNVEAINQCWLQLLHNSVATIQCSGPYHNHVAHTEAMTHRSPPE